MARYTKQTVDKWLNTVNYEDLNRAYEPSNFALQFSNFIKLVNGEEGEENTSPPFHYKMADQYSSKERRIANLCFRGSGKTTLTEYLFLYLAVFNEIPGFGTVSLAMYISDSIDNGVKAMRENLEFRLENSDFLKAWIKDYKFTLNRWVFVNQEGKKTIVKGYGAKSGVRGVKEMGKRPTLAVLDDLLSDEDARSPAVINSIEATIQKAIKFALHPDKQKIIWNGTPFNKKDPLYKAVESGGWKVNAYPVCEQFPCDEKDFKGAWGDRFGFQYVRDAYVDAVDDGDVSTFYQELMLRIMGAEERLVNVEAIVKFDIENVLSNKHAFNFYFTTDFATSEKQGADFSVIGVWAYTNNGEFLLVDGVCRRQTMDKNMDDLFRLAQIYRPESVGIEVSGQQGGFIPWVYDQMMVKNIYFGLASSNNQGAPGMRPVNNKLQRFNVVVPWFSQRKIWIAKEMLNTELGKEVIEELTYATVGGFLSKNDDASDMISMLSEMVVWKPSHELTKDGGSDGVWGDDIQESGNDNNLSSYIV